MMAYRCKLLWPRVHPYTQPTSSQPPTEKRGPSSQDKWVGRRRITGGKSKLGSPSSRKNRHRRQTTETEEIIIPAPGGRPSHPPTHNTSTTSPWSQYPSPLQSGISSPHLLNSPTRTFKVYSYTERIEDIWVVRIPQRAVKKNLSPDKGLAEETKENSIWKKSQFEN